ncbi:MAG: S1C family serine protease [Verrucomicrobiota bacterium]
MSAKGNAAIAILLAAMTASACAQQSLEWEYRSTGTAMAAAFEPAREVLQKCSAVIDVQNGLARDEVSYGTVVSADGFILTKASEIRGVKQLRVTIDEKRYDAPLIVAEDPLWDVTLLKVEATGLRPVEFRNEGDVPLGTWVVANGATTRLKRFMNPGVISALAREIPPEGGAVLGIHFKGPGDPTVREFPEKSGARDAGIQVGDVVIRIDSTAVKKLEDIAKALEKKQTGQDVEVIVRRGVEEKKIAVRLTSAGELGLMPMSRNDAMSGMVSLRRSGFPRVLQHSIIANKHVIGGPVLDLDGKCVGMNIARANRAETFAIPAHEVKEITVRLIGAAASR